MKTDSMNETKSGTSPQEDLAHSPERQVERGITGAQGQESANGRGVVQPGARLDQNVAHDDAEPADLDHDRFGGQVPPGRSSITSLIVAHFTPCRTSTERIDHSLAIHARSAALPL